MLGSDQRAPGRNHRRSPDRRSTVAESSDQAQFTAILSQATPLQVTVPFAFSGTATQGEDYRFKLDARKRPIKSMVIPHNATQATLTVLLISDGVAEPDETLTATMGTPTNAVAGAPTVNTVTIQDN